ncbi:MAG: DHH family phosphoesterase [Bacillota bacterium]
MENKNNQNHRFMAMAACVLVIVVCFMLHTYMGVGAFVGGVVLYFCSPILRPKTQTKEILPTVEVKKEMSTLFLDTDVLQSNFQLPQNLNIPYAVLNVSGHFLMCNQYFSTLFPEGMGGAKDVFKKLMHESGQGQEILIEIGGAYFLGALAPCDLVEENGAVGTVLTVTLIDVTKTIELEQTLKDQEAAVGFIFLDNYLDIVEGLDPNQIPIFAALLERKLNQFTDDLDGIIRKLEKDRYFFIITRKHLNRMLEKRNEMTNTMREINVGEHSAISMTVGIGVGEDTLQKTVENAKVALDLALGRGGRQIIVKDGDSYTFHGGSGEKKSKHTRMRSRIKAEALQNLMSDASTIFVMGHRNADLDSMGACFGIGAIARAMEKECHIIFDKESDGTKKLLDRMRENEQEEISFLTTPKALEIMDDKTLLIIVDTHIKSLVESQEILDKCKQHVLFDHHRRSADGIQDSVLVYHEPYASSTSELITQMIQNLGKKVKLTQLEADALLAGITVDTKNFSVKTGAITFETAGFLRRCGADSIRVRLLFQNNLKAYKAKARAVSEAEIFREHIAISVCKAATETPLIVAAQAADDLMNVTGIIASFVCCEIEDIIYISARSFGEINVQRIMEKLGGGGHANASGGQLQGCTIEEAIEKIKEVILQFI